MKPVQEASIPSYIPTRKEITKAATDLIPKLRERAEEAEDLRMMPEETLQERISSIKKYNSQNSNPNQRENTVYKYIPIIIIIIAFIIFLKNRK